MSSAIARLNMPARQTGPRLVVSNEQNFAGHPDYDTLPEVIKAMVSPKEFAWMSNEQRTDLLCDCTEPDVEG